MSEHRTLMHNVCFFYVSVHNLYKLIPSFSWQEMHVWCNSSCSRLYIYFCCFRKYIESRKVNSLWFLSFVPFCLGQISGSSNLCMCVHLYNSLPKSQCYGNLESLQLFQRIVDESNQLSSYWKWSQAYLMGVFCPLIGIGWPILKGVRERCFCVPMHNIPSKWHGLSHWTHKITNYFSVASYNATHLWNIGSITHWLVITFVIPRNSKSELTLFWSCKSTFKFE